MEQTVRDQDRAKPALSELAQLMRLAGPVVIARLGIMTMGLTDAIVVGRYSAKELGYHALGWAPTSVVVTMMIGLLIGVQVMTARAIGRGASHETGAVLRRALSYGMWIAVISSAVLALVGPVFLHNIGLADDLASGGSHVLLVFCLSLPVFALSAIGSLWLEGLGRPAPAAIAMWLANLVNLGLVLLLVPGTFGLPALGAVGGAWGTFGARTFLAVVVVVYILRMSDARSLGVFDKPPRDRAAEAEQRRIGFGAGASNFLEVSAFSSMSIIAGWIGAIAVAAWAIVLNLAAIVFMVPLGLAAATAIRVGHAYGARDPAAVKRAGLVAFGVAASFGVLVAALVFPSAGLISRAYTLDAATIALAVPAMVLSCMMFAPDSVQVVAAQALRARGDVWMPTVTHLASYVLVMMPLAWFLAIPMGLSVTGIVLAIVIASTLSAALLLSRFLLLNRRGR